VRTLAAAFLVAAFLLGCSVVPLPTIAPEAPRQASAPTVPVLAYGTYEWSAADLMKRWHAGSLWSFLVAKHIDAVLVGFDDAYITKCSTPRGAAEMNDMIAQAARRGVRVDLLLGDPSWIPASGIAGLEKILDELHRVHFAGLDLDLEPNEVAGQPLETVFRELVAAMKAYIRASPWPVSLDVNHIFVDRAALKKTPYCLLCGLEHVGLKRVNLMTYVSDQREVVTDVAPILARYPSVAFTIAQSVEPPSVLPVYDSYWSDGFAVFYRDMRRLDGALKPRKNYAGLTIESMQYLEIIKP
jgi:hypothetical protein